ncbi:MAG: hypothetical protein KJ050_10565 [Candidatus Omnitrophica bacterium]|nr:hypothetical protein [Candidatus Omnitrophota bacterium]
MRTTRTTVARIFIEERAALYRAGWGLNEPQLATTLELLIPQDSGAQTWPLRVARTAIRERLSDPHLTDEESSLILRKNETLPKALKVGISLFHAGFDLDDADALDTLVKTLQSPSIFKFLKALSQADIKQVKKILAVVDKALGPSG